MAYNKDMVTIYSATWCGFCHAVKDYLDRLGVKYEDRDVERDPKNAQAAVQKSGQMGIPVIDIDGTIIIGFDRPRIDQTLKEKKLI
jgi:glutaredoxin 3